jgi:hypothetical protein
VNAAVEAVSNLLNHAWVVLFALALVVLHAILSTVTATVVRAAMLPITVRALCARVDLYTRCFDEDECEIRRADFRRYLWWDRYRRLRRKGLTPPEIAVHLIKLLVPTTAQDAVEAICAYVTREIAPRARHWFRAARWTAFAWLGEPSERVRLRRAFAVLTREHGYFTNGDRDRLLCCKNCQSAKVPDSANGAVFWDIQRDDAFEAERECFDQDYGIARALVGPRYPMHRGAAVASERILLQR